MPIVNNVVLIRGPCPQVVRFDADYTMLAKISFKVPSPMLSAQLADKEDVIGRLLAIEQLSTRHDKEALAKLKQALNDDAFYGVRIEASKSLRADHSDEALEALLTSTKQSDARVRLQVMVDIGGFYRDTAFGAARRAVDAEKNPAIELDAPRYGGHCGFISNEGGARRFWAEQRVVDFCAALATRE